MDSVARVSLPTNPPTAIEAASPRNQLLAQLIKYGIFGGLGALSDFLAFTALHAWLHVPIIPANVVSILVGITVSFLLNSSITFAKTDYRAKRAMRFFAVGITGLLLSNVLLYLLTSPLQVAALWAKLVTIPIIALLQFVLNRSWTFAEIRDKPQLKGDQ